MSVRYQLDGKSLPIESEQLASASVTRPSLDETSRIQTKSISQVEGTADSFQQKFTRSGRSQLFPLPIPPRPSPLHPEHPYTLNPAYPTRQNTTANTVPREQLNLPQNVVKHLLPYCTTEPPLTGPQVLALSDTAATLRELVLLALGAASGDAELAVRLEDGVGSQIAVNIVEFFADEWEIEG